MVIISYLQQLFQRKCCGYFENIVIEATFSKNLQMMLQIFSQIANWVRHTIRPSWAVKVIVGAFPRSFLPASIDIVSYIYAGGGCWVAAPAGPRMTGGAGGGPLEVAGGGPAGGGGWAS